MQRERRGHFEPGSVPPQDRACSQCHPDAGVPPACSFLPAGDNQLDQGAGNSILTANCCLLQFAARRARGLFAFLPWFFPPRGTAAAACREQPWGSRSPSAAQGNEGSVGRHGAACARLSPAIRGAFGRALDCEEVTRGCTAGREMRVKVYQIS